MTTTNLKKRIIRKIDEVQNAALLQAIYTILEESDKDTPATLTAVQKKELDKRWKAYKSGEAFTYSSEQVIKGLRSKLNK